LAPFFSEALIKYRVLVEIEYFIALCSALPQLGSKLIYLKVYATFIKISTEDAL
jgi:adenylosuccinate lyase